MQHRRRPNLGDAQRAARVGALALLASLAGTSPAAAEASAQTAPAAPTAAPAQVLAAAVKAPEAAGPTLPAALPFGLEVSCDSRVQRHRLKNGVEVVLAPRPGPSVHVRSSVHVGSRDDPPGAEGLAHYVEHLTFRPVPGFAPVFELYEEAGATGLNASTTVDTTDYYASVPPEQLERALWIEARRLALGLDLLAEEPALQERDVLQREHAMRFGQGLKREAMQAIQAALFPSGHPYHRTFASQESQATLSLNDARWFFARYYRPERVRLVLAGDFAPARALALAERWFGALAPRAEVAAAPGEISDACRWAKQPLELSAHRLRLSTKHRNQGLSVYWPLAATEEPEQWRGLLRFLAQQLQVAGQQTGLAASADLDIVRGELGHFYELRLPLSPAQPLDRAEPLLAKVLEEVRHLAGAELEAAARAIDLWTRRGDRSPEEQTRLLAQRHCAPLDCRQPQARLVSSALAELQRFQLGRALIVERVHAPNAPIGGEVEVLR